MSLQPTQERIDITVGASYIDTITCFDGDGLPADLTGATALQQARPLGGGDVVLELSTANVRIVLGGVAGTITRELTDEFTATLPPGDYATDLFLTWPDGRTDCLTTGFITIHPRTTRPA